MWDGRFTKPIIAYMFVGAAALIMSFLGALSIVGPFILPIPVAMAFGLLLWRRPWVVALVVGAAMGWSAGYLMILLAPWVDVDGFREVHGLALRVSLGSALVAGTLAALGTGLVTRRRTAAPAN